ncbi:MAG: hypothetical protein ACJAU1_000477, partial [Psychromonas sp.]
LNLKPLPSGYTANMHKRKYQLSSVIREGGLVNYV